MNLQPHPEGGYFRETFRDAEGAEGRAHSTAIYYLLKAGEVFKKRHRVDAVEVWHWYGGSPLKLTLWDEAVEAHEYILGNAINVGQMPQIVVPAHAWQAAESLGEYSLVGCTVAPGFEFAGFEMWE